MLAFLRLNNLMTPLFLLKIYAYYILTSLKIQAYYRQNLQFKQCTCYQPHVITIDDELKYLFTIYVMYKYIIFDMYI